MSERHKFTKVTDSRGRGIPGLWQRGKSFYGQLYDARRGRAVRLRLITPQGFSCTTVAQARQALLELQVGRAREGIVRTDPQRVKKSPTLLEWSNYYLDYLERTEGKSPPTICKERYTLERWGLFCGSTKLADLTRSDVNAFVAERKHTDRVSNRTINLDIVALNNCLRLAQQEGIVTELPTKGWKPMAHKYPIRPLWTREDIDRLCAAAGGNLLLTDYIRFMAFSGARRMEAANVAWADVEWDRQTVLLRKTKYGRPRNVDFNSALEAHLKAMADRRQPDSKWLFPSPARGYQDRPIISLAKPFYAARDAAGLPEFQFHDLRHYFISTCVMAGIDMMTIARWVGHKDGGVLIGKVYGHLNDAHAKKMAGKLTDL